MSIRPIDLRDILEYVPRFRNHIFVLGIDGSVIADSNFQSLLTDIAVLHSLNIKVVLCHGIAQQIRTLAAERNVTISDERGEGRTDDATLKLAIDATGVAAAQIMRGLSEQSLPYTFCNAIDARPVGIEQGIDQMHTGLCDSIDKARILRLLEHGDIPVFSPIIYDDKGRSLRINSDHIAATLATELGASKLIYLTSRPRLTIGEESILNCSAEQLKLMIQENPAGMDPLLLSKARHAIQVLTWNTDRVHILDGRIDGCLLIEIFDKVGLGTMIHANEYDRIRRAKPDDIADIYALVKHASKTNQLITRSMKEVEDRLENFYLYEVDDSIIGCTCLIPYDETLVELASVCIQPYHQGKGIGQKLARYSLEQAKKRGFQKVIALSTQASEFFTEHLGFTRTTIDQLPPERRSAYEYSQRNSIILERVL
ncbi:MAG: amino-acid N-acetyltransferase [Puniceicoccaceae bacterium]